jgi:hypothetical protein
LLPPPNLTPQREGFIRAREETAAIAAGLESELAGSCLPVPAPGARLPEVGLSDAARTRFLRESMAGLFLASAARRSGGLASVIDPRTFVPRCTIPTDPLRSRHIATIAIH